MSNTYQAELNLMALTEGSPETNIQRKVLPEAAARRNGGRFLGVGVLLLAVIATIGVLTGTNKVAEKGTMHTLRSLQETPPQHLMTSTSGVLPMPAIAPSFCLPPTEGDPCNTEASYRQCLAVEATGCASIAASRSCPPRFVCMSKNTHEAVPEHPIISPEHRQGSQCPMPTADNCDTDESHRECVALEATGCSAIRATRSCPPQYSCAPPTPVQPVESQCPAPAADNCDTDESHRECVALEATGCSMIIRATRSCPPQYTCAPPTPVQPIESQCLAPAPGNCETHESHQECLAIEATGCSRIRATRSCPPQYSCGTAPTPVQPIEPASTRNANSAVTLPVYPPRPSQCIKSDCDTVQSHQQCLNVEANGCRHIRESRSCPPQYYCAAPPTAIQPIESQCIAPDGCHTKESYQECLAMEASGCTMLITTASCPPVYGCANPVQPAPVTRQAEPVSVTLPADAAAVCQRPSDNADDKCHTEQTYEQCVRLASAGCRQIAASRSCPMQYMCFDWNF